jgi:hypothetical protein
VSSTFSKPHTNTLRCAPHKNSVIEKVRRMVFADAAGLALQECWTGFFERGFKQSFSGDVIRLRV